LHRLVGVERDHKWAGNFSDISSDFTARDLGHVNPLMIRGDCRNSSVIDEIVEGGFDGNSADLIIADPPYGNRESGIDPSCGVVDVLGT